MLHKSYIRNVLMSFELCSRQVVCFFPLVRRRANLHKDQASVASAFRARSSACMDSTNLGVILPKPFQQPSAIELSKLHCRSDFAGRRVNSTLNFF